MPKITHGEKPKNEMRFASFDPGDVHVGVALFEKGKCVYSKEHTPASSLEWLTQRLEEGLDYVVIERFQLYPDKAAAQHGSDMLTSQLIGAMRLLACQHNTPHVQQQAALKKPAENLINRRKIKRLSLKEGNHAKDAETHGYAFLWRG